jgi:uncharacterized protein (DUF779 family)
MDNFQEKLPSGISTRQDLSRSIFYPAKVRCPKINHRRSILIDRQNGGDGSAPMCLPGMDIFAGYFQKK